MHRQCPNLCSLGLNAFGIASSQVTTDVTGDALYLYQGALYFKDSDDDLVHQIVDQGGGAPSFDWSDSGGTGDTAWSYSQSAYAIESTGSGASKKFHLAIKNSNSWGGGESEISWETFEIKLNTTTNVWELDWGQEFSERLHEKQSSVRI